MRRQLSIQTAEEHILFHHTLNGTGKEMREQKPEEKEGGN